MYKYLLFLILSLSSLTLSAKQIICPASIVCNYENGACENTQGWIFEENGQMFEGTKVLRLHSIYWNKERIEISFPVVIYPSRITCGYCDEDKCFVISLVKKTTKINGANWKFGGFGNSSAVCNNISDPTQCAGEE